MNWGTLILGIIIGAVVVGVVWFASKPATSGADAEIGQCIQSYLARDKGTAPNVFRALYCCGIQEGIVVPPGGYNCGGGGGDPV